MKVFVSSTSEDLVPHRAAVFEVLLRMKHELVAMEYFGSRGDDPSHVCFDEIAECDILVGIYAWRYGWQPSESSPSITEQEFDYAVSKNKKCLCYIVDKDFDWRPGFMDHGEPEKRLAEFKKKINKLVRSRFTTPDNLAKQIAADLAREMSEASPDNYRRFATVSGRIITPVDGSSVSTGPCNVSGTVDGYNQHRLYLFTGDAGRYWPSRLITPSHNGAWAGGVNLAVC
jgi:hypothetical protein